MENEREAKISREELLAKKNEKAKEVVTSRILTSEEHQKIKAEQAKKQMVDIRRNVKIEGGLVTKNSSDLGRINLIGPVFEDPNILDYALYDIDYII